MSTLKIHELKILSTHFVEVLAGRKTQEVRINDRDYKAGDCLNLREISESGEYTGQEMNAQVSHVLHGGQYGVDDGWCVLSLRNASPLPAITLIEFLRDRLNETCDCIEAGYDIVLKSGHTIDDSQMTLEGGRQFIELANDYLSTISEVES